MTNNTKPELRCKNPGSFINTGNVDCDRTYPRRAGVSTLDPVLTCLLSKPHIASIISPSVVCAFTEKCLKKRIRPHAIRHSYAVAVLKTTKNLEAVRRFWVTETTPL